MNSNAIFIFPNLLFILFAVVVIIWEVWQTRRYETSEHPIEPKNSLENILLKILIILFSGLGTALLIVIMGVRMIGESGFFLALVPAPIVGIIVGVIVGRRIWFRIFPHPGSLLVLLIVWGISYLVGVGDDFLTDRSFNQLLLLFFALFGRWMVLRWVKP